MLVSIFVIKINLNILVFIYFLKILLYNKLLYIVYNLEKKVILDLLLFINY